MTGPPSHARAAATDRPPARTVADAMITEVKLCRPDATSDDVRRFFADDHVHVAVIVADGRLLAVVERSDLVGSARTLAVRLGCTRSRVVAPDVDAETARRRLVAEGRRRLAVVSTDGALLGLLCLKRDGTGFCSDQDVRARAGSR